MLGWLKRKNFNKLIQEHLDSLVQLAYMKCKNRELAEDLVQETCLKSYQAYLKMENVNELVNPKAWLFRILINTFIDHSRKQKIEIVNINDLDLEDKKNTLGEVETSLFFRDLSGALSKLDSQQRIIIYLADVNEFSYKEIAGLLQIPAGTVMSRLYRARHNLREILSASGYRKDLVGVGVKS